MKKKVFCTIVTYNRKRCLIGLLNALRKQTIEVEGILIFDNNSTDGTLDALFNYGIVDDINNIDELIIYKKIVNNITYMYYKNDYNSGGAGGFSKAIELATSSGCDYLWIMDDDVLPEENCLELLLDQINDDTKACIPNRSDDYYNDRACVKLDLHNPFLFTLMRRKYFIKQPMEKRYYYVYDMPFEGVLIEMDLVNKIGYPEKDYFLLCDDSDYAQRICMHTRIKFVTDATMHRQLANVKNNENSNKIMGWRDYYAIRNEIIFCKKFGKNILVKTLSPYLSWIYWALLSTYKRRWKNFKVINKAVHDAILNNMGKTVNPGDL